MLRNKLLKSSLAIAWAPLLSLAHGCSSGGSSLTASDAATDGQGGSSGAAVQGDDAPSDSAPGPDSADVGAGGSSGGSSSGSPSGGGPDCGCDGGWQLPCPGAMPTQGAACARKGLQCEYGASPVLACNTVATCDDTGWSLKGPTSDPVCSGELLPAACPSSSYGISVGAACGSNVGTICDYNTGSSPPARCACLASGSDAGADAAPQGVWVCAVPSAPSCPSTFRPRLGELCGPSTPTDGSVVCDYGACTVPGGISLTCVDGTWVQRFTDCVVDAGAAGANCSSASDCRTHSELLRRLHVRRAQRQPAQPRLWRRRRGLMLRRPVLRQDRDVRRDAPLRPSMR